MAKLLDVVLLTALPASGKSEVRKYLARLTPEQCRDDFRMGPTVQLDDYPYVHLMRTVSDVLLGLGHDGIFFDSAELPMKQPLDWGMLIHLVNEDFTDLLTRHRPQPASAAEWMLGRFDAARAKVGAPPVFASLDAAVRERLLAGIEQESAELLRGKNAGIPESLEGSTVVIEFARGGKEGSSFPLPAPFGYRYAFSQLSPEILERSAVLYIWVSPEESRRKNFARSDPGKAAAADKHLSLFHGVPIRVMLDEYGCDDMAWLLDTSDLPHTARVEAHGRVFHLPIARFDNRIDRTTFVRGEPSTWSPEDVRALHEGLREAFATLPE